VLTLPDAIARLSANVAAFEQLLTGVSPDQARWKPDASQWSILEVVNHLADEEVEDFRQRLALTLRDPKAEWPPIDPQGWPVSRNYVARGLDESFQRFVSERARSLEWLRSLGDVDLKSTHHHRLGDLSAGDLLGSWLAHDLIHLRQIIRLQYRWLERQIAPFSPAYAGAF
jgi:hypothetical protein